MTAKTDTRLAPRQRLNRGLKYTAVGPVDITRGVVGLGVHSAQATATGLRKRYQSGQLRRQLAAAAHAVTALPEVWQEPAPAKRRRRPWLIAAAAAGVIAGGAVVFSVIRRSTRPEPAATLPPSVDVTPKL